MWYTPNHCAAVASVIPDTHFLMPDRNQSKTLDGNKWMFFFCFLLCVFLHIDHICTLRPCFFIYVVIVYLFSLPSLYVFISDLISLVPLRFTFFFVSRLLTIKIMWFRRKVTVAPSLNFIPLRAAVTMSPRRWR